MATPFPPFSFGIFRSRAAVAEIDARFFGCQHHNHTTPHHHPNPMDNPLKLVASVSTFAFLAEAAGGGRPNIWKTHRPM